MTGKFIQLAQLSTFLTKVKEWANGTFLALEDAAAVATSGAAADVSVADTAGNYDGTTVEAVLAEIATDIAGQEVTLEVKSTPNTGYLKSYTIKQGGNSVGDIDIPKDLVVTGGQIMTGTWNGNTFTPDQTQPGTGTGKALALTIANQTDPVYINVADLVDVYTVEQNASKIQLAISANNVISATVVTGSIAKTDLTSDVQASLDLADSALQESDIVLATDTDINNLFA